MAADSSITSPALGNVPNLPTDSGKPSLSCKEPICKDTETLASLKRYLDQYSLWLETTCPSPHTRRIYLSRVKQFLRVISDSIFPSSTFDVHKPSSWKAAVNAYKVRVRHNVKPSTINAVLNALQNFVRFLELKNALRMQHLCLPYQSRTLTVREQECFITALAQLENAKHRAIGMLLFYTGIKVGQLSALDLDDLSLNDTHGKLLLKQGNLLEIMLSQPVVQALREWLAVRNDLVKHESERALFLNQEGKRLATSSIDPLIRKIGTQAHLYISPQVLRHTFLERQSLIDTSPGNQQ